MAFLCCQRLAMRDCSCWESNPNPVVTQSGSTDPQDLKRRCRMTARDFRKLTSDKSKPKYLLQLAYGLGYSVQALLDIIHRSRI